MSKIVYPNYDKSILGIIASIRKYFNLEHKYASNTYLDSVFNANKYKHIVFILLDGMGINVIKNNLNSDDILVKSIKDELISIFPSTTAAATTSAISGLTPLESGWTGWQNHIKEANKDIVLFTGLDYYSNEPTGINVFKLLPYKPFWEDLPIYTQKIMPPFDVNNGVKNINQGFKKIRKTIKEKKASFTYFYWTEPDSTMHEYGCKGKESLKIMSSLNDKIEGFTKKLNDDTIVIITADHGHIDVEPIILYQDEKLLSMLQRRPANDSRAIAFKVLEKYENEFKSYFEEKYGEFYRLYKSEDAINLGFFGDTTKDVINERICDFLGNYFAVATSNKYFVYANHGKDAVLFKSHHAGMTEEEMIVPLIIIVK